MKKSGKLAINPDKIIKNEELVNLRGGYDGYATCAAISGGWDNEIHCNVSKAEAIFWAGCDSDGTNCSGNWCCDSCQSATWYNC